MSKTINRKILIRLLLLLLSISILRADSKSLVIGTGLPQFKTFIEKVGGNKVKVTNLLSPGDSAHTYTPSPLTLATVMRSHIYFSSGLLFEERIASKLADSVSGPIFINLSERLPLIEADDCGCSLSLQTDEHKHNDQTNSHSMDLHTWLDPVNVMTMCIRIKEVLSQNDPDNKSLYAENCLKYINKLKEVDQSIQKIFETHIHKSFYVYHPALGYFAQRYQINQIPIETGGKEPSGRQLTKLIREAELNNAHTIFVQKGFSVSAAERLAATINGKVEFIDPLAEDYCNNLLQIANQISNSMK
jgi:zinc transport system substrate-binding protein